MEWEVRFSDEFGDWWDALTLEQQEAVYARVQLLTLLGPDLGRPVVDSIKGSKHQNMKELRASTGGALRILFIFDPVRRAVLLFGGDKSGRWKQWYVKAIPQADRIYDEYLAEIQEEGLDP